MMGFESRRRRTVGDIERRRDDHASAEDERHRDERKCTLRSPRGVQQARRDRDVERSEVARDMRRGAARIAEHQRGERKGEFYDGDPGQHQPRRVSNRVTARCSRGREDGRDEVRYLVRRAHAHEGHKCRSTSGEGRAHCAIAQVGVERHGLDRGELVVESGRDEFAVATAIHAEDVALEGGLVPSVVQNADVDELTSLALAAGAGDRVALASFVRRTQADVWRFCAHVNGRAEADDLTQETYLRAIPALARFEGRSSARAWLLSIARRTCADSVRRTVRRRRLVEQAKSQAGPEAHPPASGEVDLGLLLAGLDHDRRQAFVLTQILGLSYAETAEACACPVGTIRSRVARAREDLMRQVGQAESG